MTRCTFKTRNPAALQRAFGAAVLALAILPVAGTPAPAQGLCMPRAEIAELLGKRYSETRTALGLADNGGLLEVFTAGNGATWTIVMTSPQGRSCVVTAGEAWQGKRQVALGPQA
jgi:hypothetical protein